MFYLKLNREQAGENKHPIDFYKEPLSFQLEEHQLDIQT
jgi:hypothetical protein